MAEYYYFASTLPMLSMDREPPVTYEEFMRSASEHLSKKDYHDLSMAVFGENSGGASIPVVRDWQFFAGRLSSAINRIRASRLGFSGYENGETDREMEERARDIVENRNPLEGEKAVLSAYFDFLSSYESGSPFSSKSLMIYALKLQLIERLRAFDEKKGRAEFDRLYSSIEEDIFR